jgi:DsbC/DsbD-like thiol-disulfide interchange protein
LPAATIRPRWSVATIATAAILALVPSAVAAEASAWDGDDRAAARLIAAGARDGTLRAGIEIRLAPGWKTYWRYPGDSGVPPRFDFSGSENVASARVLWPAPQHFSDAEGDSIGYKGNVVFPVHIRPNDAGKPVTLRLKLDYAACEKICLPLEARAALALSGRDGGEAARVAAAEARVPRAARLGDGAPFAIRQVRQEPDRPPRIVVDVAAPAQTKVQLFAEGPTPGWALPIPKPEGAAADGVQRFSFVLDGLPSGASAKGAALTLTAVAGEQAIEVPVRLD